MDIAINHILIVAALFGLYKLIFAQSQFFKANRLYLLSIPLISILIIVLSQAEIMPSWEVKSEVVQEIIRIKRVMVVRIQEKGTIDLNLIAIIYLVGATTKFIWILAQYFTVYYQLRNIPMERINGSKTKICFSEKFGSFSFFNIIHLNLSQKANVLVLEHELTHIKKKHPLEILIHKLMSVLFWFNPLMYLIERELKLVHEYEVDLHISQKFSRQEYLDSIMSALFGIKNFALVHQFKNKSTLLKRIKMMNNKYVKVSRLSYLLILPSIALIFLMSCSIPENNITFFKKSQSEVAHNNTKPQYPGGFEAMVIYIQDQFELSDSKNLKEGKVMVGFDVLRDGQIKNVVHLDGEQEELGVVAIRIVRNMPKWIPASKDGIPVDAQMVLPIIYQLENE